MSNSEALLNEHNGWEFNIVSIWEKTVYNSSNDNSVPLITALRWVLRSLHLFPI